MWESFAGSEAITAFDPRDVHILATLCDVADLEAQARTSVKSDPLDAKAHASYARLVDKKLQLLDAMALTPKSRRKLGEVPVDEVAEQMRDFAAAD